MKLCCVFRNKIKTLSVILLVIIAQSGISQPIWSKLNVGGQFIEDYDKGYVFANGLLVKTDVNGNEKYKILLQPGNNANQKIALSCIVNAENNSIIAGGYEIINSTKSIPFICKFNYCKQLEWCRTFELSSTKLLCKEIISVSDNKYYCLFTTGYNYEKEVYVVKINSQGSVEWTNRYCNNTTYDTIKNTHLCSEGNNGIILSGTTAFTLAIPDFGNSALRPFWIKIDSAGNQQFDTIYNPNLPTYVFRSGTIHKGINDANGNMYYGGGSGYFDPVNDGYFKLNKNNFSIQWYPLSNNSPSAMADWQIKAIAQVNDNELILASSRQNSYDDEFLALLKTDTLGNLIDFYEDRDWSFDVNYIKLTSDNKLLISGAASDGMSGGPINYVPSTRKFNLDFDGGQLEPDTYTYDSLCSFPIITDTILLPSNCATLSIPIIQNQSQELQLKIYPNPATTFITIEIPEFSVTNTTTGFVTQQQFRPLKGELQLSFMNVSGQIVRTDIFDASERNHVVDVNKLPAGMYVMHLTQLGKFIAQGRVVVVR